jgi:predicted PurR-regulated permease PerM
MVDRSLIQTLLVFCAILGGIYLLAMVVLPFLAPSLWALIVGVLTFPLYRRLKGVLGQREGLAAVGMTLGVVLGVLVPLLILVSILAGEVASVYRIVSDHLVSGGSADPLHSLTNDPRFAPTITLFKEYSAKAGVDLYGSALEGSKAVLSKMTQSLTALLANSFGVLLDMVAMLFILYFVYADGERALIWLKRVTPVDGGSQRSILLVIQNVLSAFIYGTFLTSLVQAVLAGIAYAVLGVPSPLLLAVLTGIGGLVPVVGTALVWGPAALYLYLAGATTQAIGLVIFGAVVIGMADNVVKPMFMSSRVQLPVVLMMVGVLGGLASFGVLGAIMGPLLLAVLYDVLIVAPADMIRRDSV